ncbi:MAG: class I SAM-dependent methyltransferase [Pseudomonadota bacterium]
MNQPATRPDVFSPNAAIYDRSRRRLIPCFDDFYGAPTRILAEANLSPRRCLDLGAGTGLMTAIMLGSIAPESVVLFDRSAEMLARAAAIPANGAVIRTVVGDMPEVLGDGIEAGDFDAIWSSLAIHHLDGAGKRALFARLHDLLAPDGVFINADQSLGRTPTQETSYRANWLTEVRRLGAPEADIEKALERMKEDRMDPLDDQLRWLEDAGFEDVGCWYQNWSFNVYSGRKRA